MFVAEAINSLAHMEHISLFELNTNQYFNNNIIANIANIFTPSKALWECRDLKLLLLEEDLTIIFILQVR